jgi:hypothetical protein
MDMDAEKKRLPVEDLVIIAIIAVLGLYIIFGSGDFRLLGKLFPRIFAGMTLLACLAQVFISIRKHRLAAGTGKAKAAEPGSKNYWLITGISAVYLAVLPFVGFILSTIALMVVIPVVLGYRNKAVIVILGVVLTLSFYYVFKVFFYVPLPQGILTFI